MKMGTLSQSVKNSLQIKQGTHSTGKTGKMTPKKVHVSENTGNLEILPKHREFGFLNLEIP